MNIIYVSSLIPPRIFDEIFSEAHGNYVIAPNKFHHTIVAGFISGNHRVKSISVLPNNYPHLDKIEEEGIEYYFCKHSDIKGLKQLQVSYEVIHIIRKIIAEGFFPDVIICDILNVSLCLGAIFASKYFKIKNAAIVTDILGISEHEEKNLLHRLASRVSNSYITTFDNYILLTEQMNSVVNPHHKPYIIMEAICSDSKNIKIPKPSNNLKKLFYAGGRPEKDGIELLIKAFKRIEDDNLQLNIFGPLPNVEIGEDLEDRRIIYHGTVDNNTVLTEEVSSYLLINPRPTGETYTHYSFPSKIMEYMSSGVPMVTTRLAGIPNEYYEYVFTFDNCNVESYYRKLKEILSMPKETLLTKGLNAKKFVLNNKNQSIQTNRIIELIKN